MRKLIFFALCLIFLSGTILYAASYKVSGTVYQGSGGTTVANAATTLTSTWKDGTCKAVTTGVSAAAGGYSLGWNNCGLADLSPESCKNDNSCVDRSMVAVASKVINNNYYSGGKAWDAKANTESKNLRIYQCIRDDIIICPYPATFAGPTWSVIQPTDVIAFDNNGGEPTMVTGYNTTLTYDESKMLCINVEPVVGGEFTVDAFDITTPGVINVQGHSYVPDGIPLGDAVYPTPIFTLTWEVPEPETVDYTYVLTEPSSEIQIFGQEPNHPIAFSTEFKVGDSTSKPYFRIADFEDWSEARADGYVYPMTPERWEEYIMQWQQYTQQGEPYPDDVFLPPELYVYEGDESDPCKPDDAGLVMGWGDDPCDGDYAAAWVWDYKKDPDLSNCTINLVVTAPQFGASGQINQVSFGLQNPPMVGGPIRAWYWNCGAPGSGAPITWGVPTRLSINTSITGINAATPTASAYMNNPGFNLKLVQWMLVDENGTWIGGPNPSPGPGGFQFLWNYWHWVMVSPNTTLAKDYYKKWSQAAVVIDTNDPPLIQGWDQYSDYNDANIVADDWKCMDDRPITDLHWWGSFIGWNEPDPPPVLPQSFHIGIWTDVPDPDPNNPDMFSHPGKLVWEHFCDTYVMNFAGYDVDPRYANPDPCAPLEPTETCFQFNQLLSQEDWFYQEHDPCDVNGTVYWLSISAVWDPLNPPEFKWGWKTRSHYFNDDAVIIESIEDGTWPPTVGSLWGGGVPIQFPPYPDPDSISFDMAFELTTNEPNPNDPPDSPDLNHDGTVNLYDLAILADKWLETVQY